MVNLLICILFGIVLYYTVSRLSHPGLGVLHFDNPISFDTYVFVDADKYRYAIDEVFVTFGGGVWYHVATKGEQVDFDIGKMERPYRYLTRCNIKTFTKNNRLIRQLSQLEKSYNKDHETLQIDSLKIPRDLELAKMKLYSEAMQDALKWIIEKALVWNDFINGYMPSNVRKIDELIKLKLEIQCLFKAIRSNESLSSDYTAPIFRKYDVFDEIRLKHETSPKLYWSWDHLISYSLLRQIRLSLETLAEKLNNKKSRKLAEISTIVTRDLSKLKATVRHRRRDIYQRNAQVEDRKKRRFPPRPLASPLSLPQTTKNTRQ